MQDPVCAPVPVCQFPPTLVAGVACACAAVTGDWTATDAGVVLPSELLDALDPTDGADVVDVPNRAASAACCSCACKAALRLSDAASGAGAGADCA